MGDTFSGCEIVELGIQIEKNVRDFFSRCAERADNPHIRRIFEHLADEDARHVEIFSKIFESSCKYEPKGAYPEEYFSYMNSLADSYVFTREGKGAEMAKNITSDEEAVDIGILYVKDELLFCEGVKGLVPEEDLTMVEQLIREERKHLKSLCDLKQKVR